MYPVHGQLTEYKKFLPGPEVTRASLVLGMPLIGNLQAYRCSYPETTLCLVKATFFEATILSLPFLSHKLSAHRSKPGMACSSQQKVIA